MKCDLGRDSLIFNKFNIFMLFLIYVIFFLRFVSRKEWILGIGFYL